MNKLMGNGGTKSMSPVTEEPENVSLHLVSNSVYRHFFHKFRLNYILDDQTQVYSKPAGQPEHASLNQCQLIAAN